MELEERDCRPSEEIKVEGWRRTTHSILESGNQSLQAVPLPPQQEMEPPKLRSDEFFEIMKNRAIKATPRRKDGAY